MDIVTISEVITGIAAILALIFGQKSLLEFLRNRKKNKQSKLQISIKNKKMLSIFTNEALKNRNSHSGIYQNYINLLNDPNIKEILQAILFEGNYTHPAILLPNESDFIDCICSTITKEGKSIAILPSRYSTPDIEGIGRTSLILRLLGIVIPYGRLIGIDYSSFNSFPQYLSLYRSPSPFRLLTADIAYLGVSGARLSVVPTKGEYFSLLWDIARHIFRIIDLEYHTGKHREISSREKFYELFYRIPFSKLMDVYGNIKAIYSLDQIFILHRIESSSELPSYRLITGNEKIEQLRSSMLVSLEHGSSFWKRNSRAVTERVDTILENLDVSKLCDVIELTISNSSPVIPNYVFDELIDLISIGEINRKQIISSNITNGVGVRYHNDVLLRSIYDIDNLKILVTSGEHLIKDSSFWKSLCQLKRKFHVIIILLDPDSKSIEERETVTYADKEKGFLYNEIKENIETIKRMSLHFKSKGDYVKIQCKLITEVPPFRMTFIGKERLLVAPYSKKHRTGFNTVFYDIQANQENSLFYGFNNLYEDIESKSKSILR